jgi:hypothetical protein
VQHIWSFRSHTIICHGILHYTSLSSFNKGDSGERREFLDRLTVDDAPSTLFSSIISTD